MTIPEFHRLEDFNTSIRTSNEMVCCTFKTERFGYLQTRLTRLDGMWKFETLDQEPDLNMFTEKQIHHMQKVARIVWRLVYDVPAATERFA